MSSSNADEVTLKIEGHGVKCTRLRKVLYPALKFTKAEVIEYYVRVAPFILPHLKGRPVTLKRYPDGVTSEAYWEKDAPSFTPEWVVTFPVPRHAGGPAINHILIQNTATLAWAANAAALELRPFLHRAPQIGNPTSIVFDLDLGEGADLRQCIRVALRSRRRWNISASSCSRKCPPRKVTALRSVEPAVELRHHAAFCTLYG
jgi:bifunctional non-homologous end joining protein LigD